MFLQFVLTSLLVNSLYLHSVVSHELNQTRVFSIMKSAVDFETKINTKLEDISFDQRHIKLDQSLIKEELTLLKAGQNRLEKLLNVIIQNLNIARSCAEAMSPTQRSGIYEIRIPSYSEQLFKVSCDAETQGGNWTIILRRMDGSENFYRNWTEYKEGFGNLTGELFLGLDKIHALTNDQPQELLVLLQDFKGESGYEVYDAFAIGDESELYKLHTLGKGTGTVGDSLSRHLGMSFTTYDRDNDKDQKNCAKLNYIGW